MKKALFPVNPWTPKLLFQSLKSAKERKISANKTQTVRNENIKNFLYKNFFFYHLNQKYKNFRC